MKKGLIIIVSLILCEALLLASVDPMSVLDQMPSPEVNYEVAPKKSYPEPEPKNPVKSFSRPAIDNEKIIENLVESGKSQIERFAPIIDNLSRPPEKPASQSQEVKASIAKTQPKTKSKSQAKTRPPKVVKQTNVKENLETIAEIPLIASAQALLKTALEAKDTKVAAKTQKEQKQDDKPENSADNTDSDDNGQEEQEQTQVKDDEAAEEETTAESKKSWDSVLAKAKGLHKKENWKGIKKLFADNPEAGDTKAGLEYMLEAELNAAKPNSRHYKRYADQLLKKDRKSGLANYALALYYFNARRPNPKKASSHLAIALKAKNPPPGASKLYWTNMLKSSWKIILILIAAIIGGIDYLRKKRKKAKGEIPADAPEGVESQQQPEEDTKPAGKLSGFKAKLLEKLAPIINKIKKKKPKAAEDENIDEATPSEAAEGAEGAEGAENTEAAEVTEVAEDAENKSDEAEALDETAPTAATEVQAAESPDESLEALESSATLREENSNNDEETPAAETASLEPEAPEEEIVDEEAEDKKE